MLDLLTLISAEMEFFMQNAGKAIVGKDGKALKALSASCLTLEKMLWNLNDECRRASHKTDTPGR